MRVYSALYPQDAHLMLLGKAKEFTVVFEPQDLIDEDGVLILHGGSDISPSLYGQSPCKHTYAGSALSNRDRVEVNLARSAIEKGIPIFGICRGAQLLCALAGGSLVQDITGHGTDHRIITKEGEELRTSSLHHQMMNPFNIEHEMLAWTAKKLSRHYVVENEQEIDVPVEPEIIFFPSVKGLAVQGHPEYMNSKASFVKHCLKLIGEKLI